MLFHKRDTVVMIGDSITDCGRARPRGEGRNAAHGDGYVAVANALLQAVYAPWRLRIVNMGISGNTVRDLKARWDTDVLALKPDWVSVMIGINDVWRQYDQPTMTETHVGIEEYESTLRELIERTKPEVKGIVLMTPFYIEPNRGDPMRAAMDRYGEAVRQLSAQYGTRFVDTQASFDAMMTALYPAALAWDRVHPGLTGHAALARAFLNEIGFSWNGAGAS